MKPYYEQDGITIYHGDCREVLPTLTGVSTVLTDPPYGVLDEEWDSFDAREYSAFTMSWLGLVRSLRCPLISFAGEKTRSLFTPLLESLYPKVRQVIWSKGGGGIADDGFWFSYESLYVCGEADRWEVAEPKARDVALLLKAARTAEKMSCGAVDMAIRGKKTGLCYRWEESACIPTEEQVAALKRCLPLGSDFDAAVAEAREMRDVVLNRARDETTKRAAKTLDVLNYPPPSNPLHPCEKPIGLLTEVLVARRATGLVIDPFGGSGTTMRACKDLSLPGVMCEKSERYCEVAANRLAQGVLFGAGGAA